MKLLCTACTVLLVLLYTDVHSQVSENYFRDTVTRSYNGVFGSFSENDQYIYFWGEGTGQYSLGMPVLHKVDTAGNEIWNTAKSALLGFDGYIIKAVADASFLYAFGFRNSPYGFFMAKIDKTTGTVLYEKDSYTVNAEGIIDARDQGPDSLRIVCYTYDGGQGTYDITPINAITFSKTTGIAAPATAYGIPSLVPLYIDAKDVAYYYTSTDSLIKYNTITGTVVWKNLTYLPGRFFTRTATNLVKDNGMVYLSGDRYCRGIDDNTGLTSWNIELPSNSLEEFWPYQILIKADTIYTSWNHPYSGSVTEYNHLSKVNKLTGATYFNGTIMDQGGVNYSGQGNFRNPRFSVDARGDIYVLGYYVTGNEIHAIKKLSGTGALISETALPADTLTARSYNVVPGYNRESFGAFLFNGKACFLYAKSVTNRQQSAVRADYIQTNANGEAGKQTFYDNNYYQFPSTVIDIQKKSNAAYILKRQGGATYLEKMLPDYSLAWRKELDSCFFIPQSLAIDSAENICIAGGGGDCSPNPAENGITGFTGISRLLFLDKNGNLLKDLQPGALTHGEPLNLLGGDNNFWLAGTAALYKLDPVNGAGAAFNYGSANFSSAIYNSNSNKVFLTVNSKDSVYIFSGRLSGSGSGLCIAVSKTTGATRTVSLSSSFPQGYLLHAVKSTTDSNTAYVSGLTGDGSYPVIIKYNFRTNTMLWKYLFTGQHGEAFKTVQEPGGNLYAMVRIIDSTKIVKLNNSNGNVIWQYGKFETDAAARNIDIDVSPTNKMVVAAGSSVVSGLYKPYIIELNTDNGALINLRTLSGDAGEQNFIQAVESLPGSAVLVGGKLNAVSLGGKNGFIWTDGVLTTAPVCNVVASFSAQRDPNNPARFILTNTSLPDTGTLFFRWGDGNGDSSLIRNTSFTYQSPGTYTITLVALRDHNCSSSYDTTVVVSASDICPIMAAFSYAKDTTAPGRVVFQNHSLAPAGAKYDWNFGDGSSTDSSMNPEHVYKKSGTYTICLQASLGSNCTKNVCDTISFQLPGGRMAAYPNPSNGEITLVITADKKSVYTIRIVNAFGSVVQQSTFNANAGINNIKLSLVDLRNGVYFIEAANDSDKLITTVLKQ